MLQCVRSLSQYIILPHTKKKREKQSDDDHSVLYGVLLREHRPTWYHVGTIRALGGAWLLEEKKRSEANGIECWNGSALRRDNVRGGV